MITQIPALIQLLHKLQYPHADILNQELSNGFPLLGRLQPGLQWHVREDNTYKQPQTIQELRDYNRNYILRKLETAHVDSHWEMMAERNRLRGISGPHAGSTSLVPETDDTPTNIEHHTT